MSSALRESGVLLLGCLLTALVHYLIDDQKPRPKMIPFANPLAALFIPILFCFVRAGFVPRPSNDASKLRSVLYQVFIAFALIFLLVFEIGVGLLIGAQGIPFDTWFIVAGLGVLYVMFYCLAEATNRTRNEQTDRRLHSKDYPIPETQPTNR